MIPGINIRSADELREEFDTSFAEAVRTDDGGLREFVLVGAGKTLAALPVGEIRGIESDVPVVPVPSRVPSLLGVAGVRSQVVPVFSLPVLLGTNASLARWQQHPVFALLDDGRGGKVGLGFERLLRFVRVSADDLLRGSGGAGALLRHEDEVFALVDPRALLQDILMGAGTTSGDGAKAANPSLESRRETNTR